MTLWQAGSGNVLGSKFEEIAAMIALVEDKSRVGVCIDTCESAFISFPMAMRDRKFGRPYVRSCK